MRVVKVVAVPLVALLMTLGLFAASCTNAVAPPPSPNRVVAAIAVSPTPTVTSANVPLALAVAPVTPVATPIQPVAQVGNVITTKNKAGESIVFDPRKLMNNLWGAPAGETLNSSIYLQDAGKCGWEWSRPAPLIKSGQTIVQPIYPSIRIGGSPWEKSSTSFFPVKVGDIHSLQLGLTYSFPTAPTGKYDLAYDIFLLDTNQPSSSPKIKTEVMIWLEGTARQPPASYKGDFSDGINTYKLYSWVMGDGRQYYSFILTGPPPRQTPQTVDAARLMGYLNLNPDWYIHGVELGNEIWDGAGKIQIDNFTVSLNGQAL